MAKLTFLFVFGMVLYVSLGSTTNPAYVNNPLTNPVITFIAEVFSLGNRTAWDFAMACSGLCDVYFQAPICVNIPDVIDCVPTHTACTTACDGIFGCYASCKSDCMTNYPCGYDDLIQETGCTDQRLVCISVCNMRCVIQQKVKFLID